MCGSHVLIQIRLGGEFFWTMLAWKVTMIFGQVLLQSAFRLRGMTAHVASVVFGEGMLLLMVFQICLSFRGIVALIAAEVSISLFMNIYLMRS